MLEGKHPVLPTLHRALGRSRGLLFLTAAACLEGTRVLGEPVASVIAADKAFL